MHTVGIYAGSFDPITIGHLSVIRKACRLFERVIVAVGSNPAKTPMFTAEERVELVRDSIRSWIAYRSGYFPEIISFDRRYLVDIGAELGATHIVRGIRNGADFDAEYVQATFNERIQRHFPEKRPIDTVFIPADRDFAHVSSSAVKSLIGFDGWEEQVAEWVTPTVRRAIEAKYDAIAANRK